MKRKLIEFDLYISPDGETYDFNTTDDRFLFPVGNLGMAQPEYIIQRGPFQHGVTPLDYFLQPRVIQLMHRRNSCNRTRHYEARSDILNIIRPNRQLVNSFETGVLRKILPNGDIRDLNVLVEEGPSFNPPSGDQWDAWSFQDVIRFIAFDPVPFDPTDVTTTWVAPSMTELEFPIDFPIDFDSDSIRETKAFTYSGTWLSYPTIVITGPMEEPVIRNIITNEKLKLDYNVPAGRVVTMVLDYGKKTVKDDLGVNLIGTLTDSSDLATFHISPDPEAIDGLNSFRVKGGSVVEGVSSLVLSYKNRYIGY